MLIPEQLGRVADALDRAWQEHWARLAQARVVARELEAIWTEEWRLLPEVWRLVVVPSEPHDWSTGRPMAAAWVERTQPEPQP